MKSKKYASGMFCFKKKYLITLWSHYKLYRYILYDCTMLLYFVQEISFPTVYYTRCIHWPLTPPCFHTDTPTPRKLALTDNPVSPLVITTPWCSCVPLVISDMTWTHHQFPRHYPASFSLIYYKYSPKLNIYKQYTRIYLFNHPLIHSFINWLVYCIAPRDRRTLQF